MKNIILLSFTVLVLFGCSHKSIEDFGSQQKPNFIFIMVDDLGWSDLGYMGSAYYETPNIDGLAQQSLRFSNAYAGAANCAPSRASLMSGMQSPRTGIYTVSPSTRGDERTRQLIPVENTDFLEDSVITMAEIFKRQGYVTAHFGKWHLGEDPCTQGFDVNIGGGPKGHPNSYFAPFGYPDLKVEQGEYLTDYLTKEACSFISNNRKNPFFLYLPYYTVHTPIQPIEALRKKYELKEGNEQHNNPAYAAMINSMDHNVGNILNKLKQLKIYENTFIVFTSDNGGLHSLSRQDPLRSGKGSYYEGGVRVPLLISWPHKIKPGDCEFPVSNLDFYPTFKNLLNDHVIHKQPLDGIDLTSLLFEGKIPEERPIFFHFPVYLQGKTDETGINQDVLFRTRPGSSVRLGNYKLIHYYEDDIDELYNLQKDPGERVNLVKTEKEKALQLKILLNNWLKETKAPLPTERNVTYNAKFEQEQISKALN